jgi:DNA polymerase III delta prime subunit
MSNKVGNSFIWHEKYQPQTIEEIILPKQLKSDFLTAVEKGDFTHLLFSGTAGIGKTTLAKVLCKQMGMDYMYINSSLESGIDVLRTKILEYASTISLTGANKVVILDEADGLGDAVQKALRGFMDEFNVRFILTCNFPHKIIDPLKDSRIMHYKFEIPEAEKNGLMRQMFARIVTILEKENITFEADAVKALVRSNFPNFRKTLIQLQRYSASGNIDIGILGTTSEASFSTLVEILKNKKFNDMRSWVSDNSDIDKDKLYSDLYKHASSFVEQSSVPQMILTLSEYQYRSTFAVSQEITTAAMLTELMSSCAFID